MKQNAAIIMTIKPNTQQRILLAKHFGINRWLWNKFLDTRRTQYQATKKTSTYFKDCKLLTPIKATSPWLYEASHLSQQRTLKNLDDAYKRFFKGNARFPKFKSKKSEQSFTQHAKDSSVRGNRLHIPKFYDGLRFNRALPKFQKITAVTIRKNANGLYQAILSVERDVQPLPSTGQQAGIDLGLTDLAVFSTGKRIKAPKHFRRHQKRLKLAQQHLSRKVKGSKRRERQRMKVAAIHRQITNARKDTLHKASSYAVKNHDLIAVESLAIKNMLKNHCLALSISDAGWSEFVRQLEYKSKWYGREFKQVGRFYPSSKTCSDCGWINQSLTLSERNWTCPKCGVEHDRDLNAARNILTESGRQLSITDTEGV